jgi:hypothetical protein
VRDVIDFITFAYVLLKAYDQYLNGEIVFDRPLSIFMMPWNDAIKSQKEFRVFVYNKKVVGISQQRWFQCYGFDDSYMLKVTKSVLEYYQDYLQPKLPYESVVLDVWVDDSFKAHLIECNVWGSYSAPGSSLFHWITHYEQLHNEDKQVFIRYLKQ